MKPASDRQARRDRIIAVLLWYGTWAASACIALGMAMDLLLPSGGDGQRLVKAGVALFILLPVSRVALMFAIFVRERDHAYTAISALVLLIIAAGVLTGLQ